MAKTRKELAFIRDLYLNENWTRRFTDLIDKHFPFGDEENLFYINAGTGDHVFTIQERLAKTADVFATCEDEEILNIARDKAAAILSKVDFSRGSFDDDSFDAVLADASFVRSVELSEFFEDAVRVAKSGSNIGISLITSGSFGEIFSLLWEVLYNEDLGEHGHAAEAMITELPTISRIEEMAAAAGLINIKTHTANEVFEYENGKEFVDSPLMADFLLPAWLETLSENEKEKVMTKLAQLIDAEDGTLSFRFSVKATVLTGEKA